MFIKLNYFLIAPGFVPPPAAPPYGQAPPPGSGFGAPPQPGMYGASYAEDPLQDEVKGFEFSDKTIRNGFIRLILQFFKCYTLHINKKIYVYI